MELEKNVVYSFCYFLRCLHGCLESPPQESSIKSLHNVHQLTLIKLAVLEGPSVNVGYKWPAVSFQLGNSEILVPGPAISFSKGLSFTSWPGMVGLHFVRGENRGNNFLLLVEMGPLQHTWGKDVPLSPAAGMNTHVRWEVPFNQVLLLIVS